MCDFEHDINHINCVLWVCWCDKSLEKLLGELKKIVCDRNV